VRVICRHGHLAFYPRNAREVKRFCDYYETELVRDGDFYTFPFLKDAPRYSIAGAPYLNLPAVETFEAASPWEVMKKNGFVYHIKTGLLVPKTAVTIFINPPLVGNYFLAQSPLIQAGSRNALGSAILSYDAEYVQDTFQLRVMGFDYE
jgi:hypothetical protein